MHCVSTKHGHEMTLFNNKYRVETTRVKTWNYNSEALYFITICTNNKEHFFGEIQNGEMILNDIGVIVQSEWLQTPDIRPDMNISLDEFVVMPNHFHAIISIGENEFNLNNFNDGHKLLSLAAGAKLSAYLLNEGEATNKFGPQSKNLGAIVRGFKSSVSKITRRLIGHFCWQERYHDHIIRNQEAYLHIQQYILNNPANWQQDKFYSG